MCVICTAGHILHCTLVYMHACRRCNVIRFFQQSTDGEKTELNHDAKMQNKNTLITIGVLKFNERNGMHGVSV